MHGRSAGWVGLFTLLGIPLGLILLTTANEQMVKACLAVVNIGFSLYSLFGRSIVLESESWAGLFLCGFFAGIFGGAYGLNGPHMVVNGSLHRRSVQHL